MSLDGAATVGRAENASTGGDRPVPESLRRVVCLSVSHEGVPTERLAAVAPEDPGAVEREIDQGDRITEAIVLATCNRVEAYASTRTAAPADLEAALSRAEGALCPPEGATTYEGLDAAAHLFRVACGLESAILGEDQILGQVGDAFDRAGEAGRAGGVVGRIAEAAVRTGREARAETGINEGEVGYGGAICGAIGDVLPAPPDRVLLVGAGEMAATAREAITRRWDARVDVATRSGPKGLTTDDGACWGLDDLDAALAGADAVVTATGAPGAVLTETHASRCGDEPLVIDLATPPDVSAAARAVLDVTDLDDLAAAVEGTRRDRRAEVEAVEGLIDDALSRLVTRERENRAEDVLRALHRKAARTREQELDRARTRLADGDADAETVLSEFASALAGKLLADPTDALREAARREDAATIDAATRLFDLDGPGPDDGGDPA